MLPCICGASLIPASLCNFFGEVVVQVVPLKLLSVVCAFPDVKEVKSRSDHLILSCLLLHLANGISSPNGISVLPVLPVSGILRSTSVQQRSMHRDLSPEKQRAVNIISRPRPSSLRSRIDPWQVLPQSIKPDYTEVDDIESYVGPNVNFVPDTEERTKSHMPSLLDIDVEGQNRDCTVPLCRMKNKTCRPSIYELEREFLS